MVFVDVLRLKIFNFWHVFGFYPYGMASEGGFLGYGLGWDGWVGAVLVNGPWMVESGDAVGVGGNCVEGRLVHA